MDRYHITALEDIDVEIVAERPRAVLGQETMGEVEVAVLEAPHWVHLAKGEECDVTEVLGIRGDLLGQGRPQTPARPGECVVVHEALQITRLEDDTGASC
ncbi:hypothetical protein AYO49_01225 [Verrucomicrobiaceae bacterium SCGC AG-212-N21]|nr:hypothetical protein AYO49_01225 [Verrucomicrobiaceae bacterium SCGC AG-212-N21]